MIVLDRVILAISLGFFVEATPLPQKREQERERENKSWTKQE
jgi:hypothetical protein